MSSAKKRKAPAAVSSFDVDDDRSDMSDDDSVMIDDDDAGPQRAAKKKPTGQRFNNKYCDFPGISASDRGKKYARCSYCKSDFSIAHSGSYDIERHQKGKKHTDMMKAAKNTHNVGDFFHQRNEALDLQVVKAETIMTEFIVKMNLPLTAADEFTKVVKEAFPDSKIAKLYGCGRSKTTAIVKHMAAEIKDEMKEKMKTGAFSIATDGSNDQKEKQFPVVVSSSSIEDGVTVQLLSVPVLEGVPATGKNIFNLLDAEMKDEDEPIPWSNCLAFGTDNANVMVGNRKGVFAFMVEKNSDIFLSGCPCHLIHHAAEKFAAALPFKVDEVLTDTFFYLDKSSNRLIALDTYQKLYDVGRHTKILKHVSTRWLSVSRCVDRILENWEALYSLFKDAADAETKAAGKEQPETRVGRMYRFYRSPTNKLYCMFLENVLAVFNKTNETLQSEAPLIHVLRRTLHKLLRDLLIRFKLPGALNGRTATGVSLANGVGQKLDNDLIIGDNAREAIARKAENRLRDSRIKEFYATARQCFLEGCRYIKEKLHLDEELLRHAEVVDVDLRLNGATSTDLLYFIKRFPCLLPEGVSRETLELEFADYQSLDVQPHKKDRIDATWSAIGQVKDSTGHFTYKNLAQVMLGICTIPHANASCERIFSCVRKNKTDQRASMGSNTLDALMVVKGRLLNGGRSDYSSDRLKKIKSAYYKSLK
ncbi:uncharacterized protein LOC135500955 [Lineus longissimus]|uniref:uncharacterized protein LOC135500955 n=2 Tax=Lineus longissimus TaxID=88925 RepID=UPI00315D9154